MWINSTNKKIFVDNKDFNNFYEENTILSERMRPWGGITLEEFDNKYEISVFTDRYLYKTSLKSFRIADKLSVNINTILSKRFKDNKDLEDIVLPGIGWTRYKI